MTMLLRMFVFLMFWIIVGNGIVFLIFPEVMTGNENKAVPYIMLIGYGIGTLGLLFADWLVNTLFSKYRNN
ncbi:hypothetical protein vecB_027 [Escherichia phage VEcB]|uniref:Uncharacterized protein n=3 Tax=Justusliebigvirus TaxID=2948775 RepID=A0A7L8ZGC8_9CAUD|nr:membrane protein [Escherichia phage muut]YP_009987236.1 membrane protein [Escherichia phage VEcB]EHO4365520.1 hypothetical protein [Escherichia coli]QHR67586.1 hypothetical protein arall_142 [Escherichia phage arall]QHR69676.1 hypothetical protein inny_6 [Escherichia phage inny]QHR75521.1 hypothetical protein outra_200 [Escherichia phage outra]UPW37334.1 hypothetical protein ESCO8_00105 [Escherichia phage vB_EcoM_ESCO8]UPW37545.1 hypothetical protein ESCO9_00051 [Escherichia phage vB_EcoM